MEKVIVKAGGKTYDILIESGIFKNLPYLMAERFMGKKLALVSDSRVYKIYGESLFNELERLGFFVSPIVFRAGEENKNLDSLAYIYTCLAEGEFTRSDIILALGGGVTGDMAGLAASTFLRGMGLIQIPTTLLAMVDSSIGGKVAVDLPQGKNLVGTFYQPDAVFADPALLETLPDNQFSSGMAELIKHGFIRDEGLLKELCEKASEESCQSEGFVQRKVLAGKMDQLIKKSCMIKRDVVEEDERDNGIRQLLNFGHTIGHAIERIQNYKGLTHGEAVSVGMVAMTRITEGMGLTVSGEAEKLAGILKIYKLPTEMPDIDPGELMAAIRIDKKTRSGRITIAYLENIGNGKLYNMSLDELEDKIYGICKN